MAYHKLTASAPACASHLPYEFQINRSLKWEPHSCHIVWKLFTNSNTLHYKVKCNATSFVSCGLSFMNCTLMGLPKLHVGKPQLLCELRVHKKMRCLFIFFIWASRYNRLGLGLRLLALSTMPPSNMRTAATTWFALVSQGHLLTFSLWPKYDLPWYHKANFLHSMHDTNNIFFGTTKLLSFVLNLGGFLPWIPPLLGVIPLFCVYVSIMSQISYALCLKTYFGISHFIVRRRPTLFWGSYIHRS